jgi:hypothetical protein
MGPVFLLLVDSVAITAIGLPSRILGPSYKIKPLGFGFTFILRSLPPLNSLILNPFCGHFFDRFTPGILHSTVIPVCLVSLSVVKELGPN